MSMPTKKTPIPSIDLLWDGRFRYSDPLKGSLIEEGLKGSGRVAVVDGDIYEAVVITDNIKGIPETLTLKTCNKVKRTLQVKGDYEYITPQAQQILDLEPYIKMRDNAWRTIQSLLAKMETPLLLKSRAPVSITPCEVDGILSSSIAIINSSDFDLSNLNFQVKEELSESIQTYHDAESILLKQMGIPATFLSRSSGMGEKEVDDASAMDDIMREREMRIRVDLCTYLGITVEWALDVIKPKETEENAV